MLFSKKSKLSQSWDERFGFFYFQFCSSSVENYVTSLSRQSLDDVDLLRGLPLAQERIDQYLDRFFDRSLKLSSVIRQCLNGFQEDAPCHISWNELAFKSKDLFHVLALDIQSKTHRGTQGFQAKPSKVSLALLGLICVLLRLNFQKIGIHAYEDRIEIILTAEDTLPGEAYDLAQNIKPFLHLELPQAKGQFLDAWEGVLAEANIALEFEQNKVVMSSKVK